MNPISKRRVLDFIEKYPAASVSLLAWYKAVQKCPARDLPSLKETFGAVDYVRPNYYVFNVGGNKYRVIAEINFDRQKMFIRHICTHEEYDEWTRKNRGK
ncbi:type II toxin-antitoxin system HigB family toxin [Cupriavidus sp. DF5525]|uniref:type II toxin-antitoxin system HigB family toxin n=1 Tax=Cupriavidus sp. DF5525 TaxID=3160989 RepID=UPI0032DEDE6E